MAAGLDPAMEAEAHEQPILSYPILAYPCSPPEPSLLTDRTGVLSQSCCGASLRSSVSKFDLGLPDFGLVLPKSIGISHCARLISYIRSNR
jgi:hypothetical protein